MKKETPQQLPAYSLRIEPEMRAELEEIAKINGRSLNAQIGMMLEIALRERKACPPESKGRSFADYFKKVKANIDPEVRLRLEANASAHGRTLAEEIAMRLKTSLRDEDEQRRQLHELFTPPTPPSFPGYASTKKVSEPPVPQSLSGISQDCLHNIEHPALAHLKDLIREVSQETIATEIQQIHKALLDAGITVQKGEGQRTKG